MSWDLHHFFDGMVRREEIASAFLATLLDYDVDFRSAFLGKALGAGFPMPEERWHVRVEEESVDVVMDVGGTHVLIENKIHGGAKQQGQLLRYYRAAIDDHPEKRIAAVYVAPGAIGSDEVQLVANNELFVQRTRSQGDSVTLVSWDKIDDLVKLLPEGPHAWFARTGMAAIQKEISKGPIPPSEARARVREVIKASLAALQAQFPHIRLGYWSARDFEEIYVYRSPVTVAVDAFFPIGPGPKYEPIGVLQDDGLHVGVRNLFRPAGKVKEFTDLAQRWVKLVSHGSVNVPGVGLHQPNASGWMSHEEHVVAEPPELEALISYRATAVLQFLLPLFPLADA